MAQPALFPYPEPPERPTHLDCSGFRQLGLSAQLLWALACLRAVGASGPQRCKQRHTWPCGIAGGRLRDWGKPQGAGLSLLGLCESGLRLPENVSLIMWRLSLIPAPGRGRSRGQLGVCHLPSGTSIPSTHLLDTSALALLDSAAPPPRARRTRGEGQRKGPGVWESRVCLPYPVPARSLPHTHTLMNGAPERSPPVSPVHTHDTCTLQGSTTSCPVPPGFGPHQESPIRTSHYLRPPHLPVHLPAFIQPRSLLTAKSRHSSDLDKRMKCSQRGGEHMDWGSGTSHRRGSSKE